MLFVCLGPLRGLWLCHVSWGSRGRCLAVTLPSHLPLRRFSEAGIREPFLNKLTLRDRLQNRKLRRRLSAALENWHHHYARLFGFCCELLVDVRLSLLFILVLHRCGERLWLQSGSSLLGVRQQVPSKWRSSGDETSRLLWLQKGNGPGTQKIPREKSESCVQGSCVSAECNAITSSDVLQRWPRRSLYAG